MDQIRQLTDICRIGMFKSTGDEWVRYTKDIFLAEKPRYATVKLTSDGICAIFVNGEFVESHIGRLPNRIFYIEITSKLKKGENQILLLCGSHFFQREGVEIYKRRGFWFSSAAAEFEIHTADARIRIPTDESWECSYDLGCEKTVALSQISVAEYDRFWNHAAIYREVPQKLPVPKEVLDLAGPEYRKYIEQGDPKYAYPQKIREDENGILFDFGRIEVGYLIFDYEAKTDSNITAIPDFTETLDNFIPEKRNAWTSCVINRLTLDQPVKKEETSVQNLRRRACRYLLVQPGDGVKILGCKILVSFTPSTQKGWFRCCDPLLNQIWEMSKYTLCINKHQEYESCPRHEMQFFSGDGVVASLVDYYTYGYEALADASLACTEHPVKVGLRSEKYSRNEELWDYPALRIIMIYNHYKYTANKAFLAHYYQETATALMWLVDKMGADDLIYQYPVWWDGQFTANGAVEFTCSSDRLGLKIYLNALLYQSLKCMSELGEIMEDTCSVQWKALAEKMHTAINKTLWSEEMGAYIDLQYPDSCPQDGNALAVLFGLADAEKTKRILQTLEKENWSAYGSSLVSIDMPHTMGGNEIISPLICGYEAEARFAAGSHQTALELIRRCWGTMIRKGAKTFWEYTYNDEDSIWPNHAHAWSAGPAYLLSAYILGIHPGKPGYASLIFSPSDALPSFEGVVPTKKGYVAVRCRTNEAGEKLYTIALPKEMELETILPASAQLEMILY